MPPALINLLLQILVLAIQNPQLQDQLATPLANAFAGALPDVTEDAIADFLRVIADKLEAAN